MRESMLIIFICIIMFSIGFLLEYWECYAKYEDEYSPVSYGPMQGCKATFNDKHIPVERIREME